LPLLTPEYLHGLPVFTKRYFEQLSSLFKPPFLIVFDDYHSLPSDSQFHEVFVGGLEAIQPGIHVAVLSRHDPPPQFSRLRANERINYLGWQDLKFSLEETKEIVRARENNKPADEVIEQLHAKTEGWVAGLVLMIESARIRGIDYGLLNDLTPEEIFDYFAGEIFKKADKDIQDFLLKTSFLPGMTVQIAEELTGNHHAAQILPSLSRNNNFTERHSHSPPVYRYHPLFREFLTARARAAFSVEQRSEIKRNAARLLEKEKQYEEAAGLYSSAGDWAALGGLITSYAPVILSQGRTQTLEKWLHRIPHSVIESSPWLLYWTGASRLSVDPNGARNHLEKALAGFDAEGDAAGAFTAWSLAIDTFSLDPSGVTQLDHWIALIDELMGKYPLFPFPAIEAYVSTGLLFSLAIRQPQRPETEELAKRVLKLSAEIQDPHLHGKTAQFLILHHIWKGDLTAARSVIDSLQGSAGYQTPVTSIQLGFLEALYSWLAAQPDACLTHVSEALAVSETTGVRLLDYLLFGQGTCAALSKGDLGTAREFLKKMSPVVDSARRNDISYYYHLASWYSLLRGDISRARTEAEKAAEFSVECGSPFAEGICSLMLAHILHRCSESHRASEYLTRAYRIGNSMNSALIEFPAFLLDALFAFDRGDEAAGLAALCTALAIGRAKGLMNYDGWHPAVMSRLCAIALESGIETEYVREMICLRKLAPTDDGVLLEQWPWPLRISTLGRFELVKEGEAVIFSGKAQQKPLLLLKALIALGGRDVPEEQFTDLVWPDADGDLAHKSFEITLLRLRRLLGVENVLRLQDGCLTLDARLCRVDAWALEHLFNRAESLWKAARKQLSHAMMDEAAQLTEQALDMYKGHFLDRENHPWALSLRERLRNKLLQSIERLGGYWEEAGQPDKAMECFARGLEIDDLSEEFYQHLMKCYLAMGRQARALETYERCRSALSAKIGIKPSSATEAVYRAILQNR
jgi:DNA-binding SARP family transcriptional activator